MSSVDPAAKVNGNLSASLYKAVAFVLKLKPDAMTEFGLLYKIGCIMVD